jgi:hypothetical protein
MALKALREKRAIQHIQIFAVNAVQIEKRGLFEKDFT